MKYFDFHDLCSSFKWMWRNEKEVFEEDFAHYIGIKYAIGTSFGRAALYLGLRAIDIREKEIIIPAFICTVVRHVVVLAGGIPRFVDVNAKNFTIDLDDLKRQISKKTKAIVLVHYFGRVARNIHEVIQIAKQHNLILIEDCAHSLGAEYKGKKIGTFGDFAIFSLTKGMLNCGGGVLVTNNYNIYRTVRRILEKEKKHLKQRIVDFPIIVAYGLTQAINKFIFDRVRKSIFKWWLINLPKLIYVIRNYIINLVKLPSSMIRFKIKRKSYNARDTIGGTYNSYEENIHMETIIASLARTHLRKINSFIQQRKKICNHLTSLENYHFTDFDEFIFKDVYTYAVLRFPNSDIFELIEKCKKSGLLLRATWPTHQEIWENQDTENLRIIEKEFLTWDVNPMVTEHEMKRFIQIVSELNN